jgi:DNA-directed RNA polymerase specialized sigma24 family protein
MMYDWALSNVFPIRFSMIDSHPEPEALGNLDSQAVTAVYNQYFPEIFRYVRYRLDDDALAEDISSEVFFRLLKALKTGRTPTVNLRGWLIGTARHMIITTCGGNTAIPARRSRMCSSSMDWDLPNRSNNGLPRMPCTWS